MVKGAIKPVRQDYSFVVKFAWTTRDGRHRTREAVVKATEMEAAINVASDLYARKGERVVAVAEAGYSW